MPGIIKTALTLTSTIRAIYQVTAFFAMKAIKRQIKKLHRRNRNRKSVFHTTTPTICSSVCLFMTGTFFIVVGFVVCIVLALKFGPDYLQTMNYKKGFCQIKKILPLGFVECAAPIYVYKNTSQFPCLQVLISYETETNRTVGSILGDDTLQVPELDVPVINVPGLNVPDLGDILNLTDSESVLSNTDGVATLSSDHAGRKEIFTNEAYLTKLFAPDGFAASPDGIEEGQGFLFDEFSSLEYGPTKPHCSSYICSPSPLFNTETINTYRLTLPQKGDKFTCYVSPSQDLPHALWRVSPFHYILIAEVVAAFLMFVGAVLIRWFMVTVNDTLSQEEITDAAETVRKLSMWKRNARLGSRAVYGNYNTWQGSLADDEEFIRSKRIGGLSDTELRQRGKDKHSHVGLLPDEQSLIKGSMKAAAFISSHKPSYRRNSSKTSAVKIHTTAEGESLI